DPNNKSAISPCTNFTVQAQNVTTLSLLLSQTSIVHGGHVTASATLGNATPDAGGIVKYAWYTGNSCGGTASSAGSFTVTNGAAPSSNSITFASAGTYSFRATYFGDPNNQASVSSCVVLTVT